MSDDFKKKVKCVEPVFEPAQKILAELPNKSVSQPETDTRIISTSKIYKKEVKCVNLVLNAA
jgi:hypothetical protein